MASCICKSLRLTFTSCACRKSVLSLSLLVYAVFSPVFKKIFPFLYQTGTYLSCLSVSRTLYVFVLLRTHHELCIIQCRRRSMLYIQYAHSFFIYTVCLWCVYIKGKVAALEILPLVNASPLLKPEKLRHKWLMYIRTLMLPNHSQL